MLKEMEIINNKYEVTKIYDTMDLYEVTDVRMRTEWVLKEISLEVSCANNTILQKDPETVIVQIEQMKKMNHRFFPKVMEIIKQDKKLYVIMEKVNGTVAEDIERNNCGTREVVNWALQLCDGLEYMEQSGLRGIRWKYGMGDILIEGGSVRIQDFEVDGLEMTEDVKVENIREIGEFINYMLDKKLRFSSRLKKIVSGCKNADIEYSDYKEVAEKLERYLMEQAKGKRLKKRGSVLAAIILFVLVVGSAGINGAKIFSKKKNGNLEETTTANPTETVEITRQPKKTQTPNPITENPVISPEITKIPKATAPAKKKKATTEKSKQVFPTNVSIITAAPNIHTDENEPIITQKPVTKVTEKPNSMDVELEDNNMDIVVKE